MRGFGVSRVSPAVIQKNPGPSSLSSCAHVYVGKIIRTFTKVLTTATSSLLNYPLLRHSQGPNHCWQTTTTDSAVVSSISPSLCITTVLHFCLIVFLKQLGSSNQRAPELETVVIRKLRCHDCAPLRLPMILISWYERLTCQGRPTK